MLTLFLPKIRQLLVRKLCVAQSHQRDWWDLQHYDLSVQFSLIPKTIKGSNVISFKTVKAGNKMQIDLQTPLIWQKSRGGTDLKFEHPRGNVYWFILIRLKRSWRFDYGLLGRQTDGESKNPLGATGITWGRDDLGNILSLQPVKESVREHLVGKQRSRCGRTRQRNEYQYYPFKIWFAVLMDVWKNWRK